MGRNTKEDLLKELEDNRTLLSIKALSEYRNNGVVVAIKKANSSFYFDKELILNDGTSVIAWI